ncbi:MAG: hypothetical protein CFE21_15260 [Bacteroidetes bacterium B1(2017)]|nr:MAG: hypothetical protein CFE21_15260 [Bacteroidetes bacterium B1(2017)]
MLVSILIFIVLTVFTQIGGLVYLLCTFLYRFINTLSNQKLTQLGLKFTLFVSLYLFFTFLIVPPIAKHFGRVPLPISEQNGLRPLTKLTCLLNRNYVRTELRELAFSVATQMGQKYPGTCVNYLDANFPFINHFPLIPHLSHNDGKKLDLSFCYTLSSTGEASNLNPSVIGYGVCEEALPAEQNTAEFCTQKGYWQYSFLTHIIPQGKKKDYVFDPIRTKELVLLFASQQNISKIFIEPHLKLRMNLSNDKIRFHGCQAVRHDDHIHVQIK